MTHSTVDFGTTNTLGETVALLHRHLRAWRVTAAIPGLTEQETICSAGNALPPQFETRMPSAYSVCRHVAEMDHELVVDNTYVHPLLAKHPALHELGIAAYVGVPVARVRNGAETLVLCALEIHERRWSKQDLDLLSAAAARARTVMPANI